MRIPTRLWYWLEERGRLPWWARLLWPTAHYCREWDYLLVDETADEYRFCRCEAYGGSAL